MSHPIDVAALQNALDTGAHPRLASSSRVEKLRWIESFMRDCSYGGMSRDERGVVRAYIQAVTGYSRAQMARYVSSHAATARDVDVVLPSADEPLAAVSPRRRVRWVLSTAVLALLIVALLLPRFGTGSPLAFLTLGSSVSSEGSASSRSDSFTVSTVTGRNDRAADLYAVDTRALPKVPVDLSARTYPVKALVASAGVPAPTTLRERVYARRDARLNIGSRGEKFVSGVSPMGNSLVDMLGMGNDGQVLTYSKGRFIWAYPNFSGTARLPTQSGSTRRYGGGSAGQATAPSQSITNNYITQGGGGLGVFVGTTSVTSYTGELTSGADTGYEAANALCNAEFDGSHLCMTDEILTTIQTEDIATLFSGVADAWIAEGPPGFTANSNDCAGWTSASSAYLGPWWEFDATGGGIGYLTNCATTKPLACCK